MIPMQNILFEAGAVSAAAGIFYWFAKTSGRSNNKPGGANDDLSSYAAIKPTVKFSHLYGQVGFKQKLLEAADQIKKNGKNGILLFGEPGNGKSVFAEALAGELGMRFLSVSYGDLQSRWIGQTTEQINAVFKSALASGPVVLFIDEAESVLRNRADMSANNKEDSGAVATFLKWIVDIHNYKQHKVLLIAATNFLDNIDAAAQRDGRFDFKMEVPSPDFEARFGLVRGFAKGVTFSEGTLERAVKRWEGFSVARMINVAQTLTLESKKAGKSVVGYEDLMDAMRIVQGSVGQTLPENTPTLDMLYFDEKQRKELKSLSNRMTKVDELEKIGASLPRGILFHGDPGTGKTAVARALAKSSGWAFIATSGQDLLTNPETLDDILNRAANLRPAIVFIDEADDILLNRAANPYGKAATNKLLASIDGVKALPDVLFVAATNFPEALDAAAVRGGRFSEHFPFEKPSASVMRQIVNAFFVEKYEAGSRVPLTTGFITAASKTLTGLSPADARDRLQKSINHYASNRTSPEQELSIEDLMAVL